MTKTTGRYQVGEEIYALAFKSSEKKAVYTNASLIALPVIMDGVVFNKLTVIEHHKVPYSESTNDALVADGYILVDETGKRYTNQYPRASYGQISDSGDRIFTIEEKGKSREYLHALFTNEYNEPVEFVSIQQEVATIQTLSSDKKFELNNPNLFKKYSDVYEMILTEFTKKYLGKKIEVVSYQFKMVDGTFESYPDILTAVVVDIVTEVTQ